MNSKRISLVLSIGFLASILVGCKDTVSEQKLSPELTEKATVADLVYTPSNHGSNINPSVHITSEGDLGLGLTFTEVDIPEKYAVVFQCQHGKFIVQDNQKKAKELWNRLKTGQEVMVWYNEVYQEDYAVNRTWWGKELSRELIARKLLKYRFNDAN
jgi:hypothetical protein